MIDKVTFITVISNLEKQYQIDLEHSHQIDKIFKGEAGMYDNSLLSNSILRLLQVWFPKDEEDFCLIENWLYFLRFGKLGDEYMSIEDLWELLNK